MRFKRLCDVVSASWIFLNSLDMLHVAAAPCDQSVYNEFPCATRTSDYVLPACPAAASMAAGVGAMFGIVGDIGNNECNPEVARLLRSAESSFARPLDFVVALGDVAYTYGKCSELRETLQGYSKFFEPGDCDRDHTPAPLGKNRFFPVAGNHDYWGFNGDDAKDMPFAKYFNYLSELEPAGMPLSYGLFFNHTPVPGIELFAVDSTAFIIDKPYAAGVKSWVQEVVEKSRQEWKLAMFHHTVYSTTRPEDADSPRMRWDWAQWGIDVVMSGHMHSYERIDRRPMNDTIYFVNGIAAGENGLYDIDGPTCVPQPGSQVRYNDNYGLQIGFLSKDRQTIAFCTYALPTDLDNPASLNAQLIDSFSLSKGRESSGKHSRRTESNRRGLHFQQSLHERILGADERKR